MHGSTAWRSHVALHDAGPAGVEVVAPGEASPVDASSGLLPLSLVWQGDALAKLNHAKPLKEILGERFVKALIEVKNAEYDLYQQVISSWERENLLLNV